MRAIRQIVCPSAEIPNALSRTCCGNISVAIAGAIGPFDQQYVRPTMKNIAISTTAAGLFPLSGNEVVRLERMSNAAA